MKRIFWVLLGSAGLVFARAVVPSFGYIPWLAVTALIAFAWFVVALTMIPEPITHFIQPPMTSLQQEVMIKIRMIRRELALSKTKDFVKVFVQGSGWVEGRVLKLTDSHGVLLLQVGESENQMILVTDIVQVRTSATDLTYLLDTDTNDSEADSPKLTKESLVSSFSHA